MQGKKTYVTGVGAIVAALVAWVAGSVTDVQIIEAVVGALMLMFIRSGVTAEAKKVVEEVMSDESTS